MSDCGKPQPAAEHAPGMSGAVGNNETTPRDSCLGGLRVLVAGVGLDDEARTDSASRRYCVFRFTLSPVLQGACFAHRPQAFIGSNKSALKMQLMNPDRITTLNGSLVVPTADAANDPDIVRDCQVVDALLRKLIADSQDLSADAAYELIKTRMKRVCVFEWDKMTIWKP